MIVRRWWGGHRRRCIGFRDFLQLQSFKSIWARLARSVCARDACHNSWVVQVQFLLVLNGRIVRTRSYPPPHFHSRRWDQSWAPETWGCKSTRSWTTACRLARPLAASPARSNTGAIVAFGTVVMMGCGGVGVEAGFDSIARDCCSRSRRVHPICRGWNLIIHDGGRALERALRPSTGSLLVLRRQFG